MMNGVCVVGINCCVFLPYRPFSRRNALPYRIRNGFKAENRGSPIPANKMVHLTVHRGDRHDMGEESDDNISQNSALH